jgi:hypothetical protein
MAILSMPAKGSRGQVCSQSIVNIRGSSLSQLQQDEVGMAAFTSPCWRGAGARAARRLLSLYDPQSVKAVR